MMKNLLLTLFTVLLASASFSQTNIDLQGDLTAPTVSTYRGTNIQFTLKVTNNGPVAMNAGDTLFYVVTLNGTPIYSSGGLIPTGGLAVGANLSFNPVTLNPPSQPSTATTDTVCVFPIPQPSTYSDTFPSNNTGCYLWERSLAGINENTINEEVSITNTFGVLNLNATTNDNYSYSVMSITGQVISQGNFANNKQVDLSNFAKGIYAVVVSNGKEKITKKIAIQ